MTKEQDFKRRFAAVLQDLQEVGRKDPKVMLLLGSLASDLSRDLKQPTWSQAKKVMTPAIYDRLLQQFENEGNKHHAAGHTEHAYGIQALAASLVAGTQRQDPDMVTGEKLLDVLIDHSVALYRAQTRTK